VANKTIDELTNLTSLASDDLFIAYDVSEPGDEKTKKVSFENLEKNINELYSSTSKVFSTRLNLSSLSAYFFKKTSADKSFPSKYFIEASIADFSVIILSLLMSFSIIFLVKRDKFIV
jgi:hypothetical protein